jgi:hypothetical protein
VWGGSTAVSQDMVEIPDFPSIDSVNNIPVINEIVAVGEFATYLILLLGFFISLVGVTFTNILPTYLSTLIFTPVAIFLVYEATKGLIRGSG